MDIEREIAKEVFEDLDSEFAKDPKDGIVVYTDDWRTVVRYLQAGQAPASGEVDLDEDYPNFCIVSFGHKGYELKHEVFTDVEPAAIRANELESKGFGIVRRQSAFTHPAAKVPEALILRKQAEAVEHCLNRLRLATTAEGCKNHIQSEAQRLRQQAAESESETS